MQFDVKREAMAPQGRTILSKLQIWRDRRGRLSWLRVAALALLLTPLAIALWDADTIFYGARPITISSIAPAFGC